MAYETMASGEVPVTSEAAKSMAIKPAEIANASSTFLLLMLRDRRPPLHIARYQNGWRSYIKRKPTPEDSY